ncbi:uncharacterized protein JCM6883_001503 [Sporobolomyces salmoneus]|uniref:uncharacterized protein n=1 Tax=Sporobolomyces salmoneus TaxID=183962 RepID=UPI00317CD255
MLRLAVIAPLIPLAAAYEWYDINNQPTSPWQKGQIGHNACGTNDSQDSMCQTVMINSVEDFCLWAPPNPNSEIGETEAEEVAWCTSSGHGARIMPEGTIHSAHMLVTPHYTQITGTGDFTKLNVRAGDSGGELDPHGADGTGNPRGGLVYAQGAQIQEWNSFISDSEFCIRVCPTSDPDSWQWCQHIYDIQGCSWNQPGNYGDGFDTCQGDSTEYPPGLYPDGNGGTSTYYQSQGAAPTGHPAGASSNCQAVATVGGQGAAFAAAPTTTSASSSSTMSSVPPSSSSSSSDSSLASSSDSSSASSSMITSTALSSTSSSSSLTTSTVISSASVVTQTSTLSSSSSSPPSSASSSPVARASGSSANLSSSGTQLAAGLTSFAFVLFGGVALFA